MERETKTITPEGSSNIYVIKAYATIAEKRQVQEDMETQVAALPEDRKARTSVQYAILQDLSIKKLVVSINGKKDGEDFDAIAFLQNLPSNEFQVVYDAVKESLDGEKKKVI